MICEGDIKEGCFNNFEFDLSNDINPFNGKIKFFSEGIILSDSGEGEVKTAVKNIEEVSVLASVGCGLIFAKMKNGSEIILCRFTMTHLKQAGEFCKIINYYIDTNEFIVDSKKDDRVCEKCGRPISDELEKCLFCYDKVSIVKKVAALFKPFSKPAIFSELFLLASNFLYISVPIFTRILFDEYLLEKTGTVTQVLILCLAMLLARFFGEVMFVIGARIFNKAVVKFSTNLRDLTFEKIQHLSMHSVSKRTPGDLIRRVIDDTDVVKDFLSDGGRWALDQSMMFLIMFVLLLFTNVPLTLLVFIPLPFVLLMSTRFFKIMSVYYDRRWRKSSRSRSILHDIIKGIRTVKSFGKEDKEIEKYSQSAYELAQASVETESLWAKLFPIVSFVSRIGEFFVIFIGGKMVLNNTISFGVLIQFLMFFEFVYGPLRWLSTVPRMLGECFTSLVKIFEIHDEEQEIKVIDNPRDVPLKGGISFEKVFFGYKSYEPVLKGINIDIKEGEMVGIVGRSGTGKSTLMNLMMRLYDPNQGRITINGVDIKAMSHEHLNENIGVVFQETFLFAGTIYDNIAYAKPDAIEEDIITAAKIAGAHDFIMNTSDGYNTVIGENGHSLSGGERQRVSIARAVIKNPAILILDEATSSLDVETEAIIQDSLNKLVAGRTTIAIAHRLSTLRSANRLIVIEKGRIAETGTHIELLRQKGLYFDLVMAQRQMGKTSSDVTS